MTVRGSAPAVSRGARMATRGLRLVFRSVDSLLWGFVRLLRALAIGLFAAGACGALVVGVATWEVSMLLPADSATLRDGRDRGSVTVLDREGQLLGVRGVQFRRLTIEEAGPVLIDAILSMEDRRFYWHFGIDPIGAGRAMLVNWRAGQIEQGGSTITQQIAKLAFLSNVRTFARKLRELPLALAMEWTYSKDELLEIYLNRAPMCAGGFGFRSAARFFYDKEPRDLTYAEAAQLAGMLRAPCRWSLTNDPEAARARARDALGAMLSAQRISEENYAQAMAEVDTLTPPTIDETASHFVDWAEQQVPERFWRLAPDLVLVTTLDRSAQTSAENAVASVFRGGVRRDRGAQAAIVILSRDGSIRAMVGGRAGTGQFNRAASARRQLGSAFKPFVYAAALASGFPPNGLIEDSPLQIGTWTPRNYSHSYRGPMPLAAALARSSNMAAIRLQEYAGRTNVVEVARRFGFAGHVPAVPSLALGIVETNPLEVASAYAVFANEGAVTPAFGVVEIRTTDGQVLWRRAPPPRRQAISVRHAQWMRDMMTQVVTGGTARRAAIGDVIVAGKTGTTQDYRDAWFAGFTSEYVAVAWMGHDNYRRMQRVTGGSFPAEMWRRAVETLHRSGPIEETGRNEELQWLNRDQGGVEELDENEYDRRRRMWIDRQRGRQRRDGGGTASLFERRGHGRTEPRREQRGEPRTTPRGESRTPPRRQRLQSERDRRRLAARERRQRAIEEVRRRRQRQQGGGSLTRREPRQLFRGEGRTGQVITRRRLDRSQRRVLRQPGTVITRRRGLRGPSDWRGGFD